MKRIVIAALALCGHAFANTCVPLQAGATDQTVYVTFLDQSTGVPTAGLAFNSSGIDLEYVRTGATATDITEATQTANGAHSDGGFVSVGHGRYRLDLPDAAVATGATQVVIQGVITGYILAPCTVALSPSVNVVTFGGTTVTGRDIGASVLLSSGTGTGQVTLTSGRVNADLTHIAAAAVSTSTAQLGVNIVNAGGSAVTASSGRMEVNTTHVSGDSAAADALELHYDGTAGVVAGTGIQERGTAQAGAAGSITFRSGASSTDDYYNCMTVTVIAGTGAGQSGRNVSDYVGSTRVASVTPNWTTNPDNTSVYEAWGTSCSTGGTLTASDVWAHATRTLTAIDEDSTTLDLNATQVGSLATLDEDSTTIDLNASFVGGVTVFDEDTTTIDINATTIGTVTTATNVTTVNGLAANVLTAASAASDLTTELQSGLATSSALTTVSNNIGTPSNLGGGATLAANAADIEAQTDDIGVAGAGLTAADDATITAIGNLNDITADEVWQVVVEDQGGGVIAKCSLSVILAALMGDVATTGANSTWEDPSGTETRATSTVTSAGNRTATITCPTY